MRRRRTARSDYSNRRPASSSDGIAASDHSATGHKRAGRGDRNLRAGSHVRFNSGPGRRYADGGDSCRRNPTCCGSATSHVAASCHHRGADGYCYAHGYAVSGCANSPSAHRNLGR